MVVPLLKPPNGGSRSGTSVTRPFLKLNGQKFNGYIFNGNPLPRPLCNAEVLQEPNGRIYDGLHTLDMGQ